MKRKIYCLLVLLLLAVMFGIISCAAIGSYSKVKAPDKMKQVKCISLTEPELAQKTDKVTSKNVDETWRNAVNTRFLYALSENGLTDYICDDDMKDIINGAAGGDADLERYHRVIARMDQNADAILKTEMEIRSKHDNKGDTYINMQLLDPKTNDVILDIKFNTLWGVGYVNKPTVLMTIRDGINGAVKQLAGQMKK